MTEYRRIPGYERYAISASGEIVGIRTGTLKQYTDKRGYKEVALYPAGGAKRKMMLVHRAVAMAWISGDHSLTVNHKDGNKSNNCVENLEWISGSENLSHSFKAGFRPRINMGKKLGQTYAITRDLLHKMFEEIRSGASIRSTAIKYGVGPKTLTYQFNMNGASL